MAEPRGILKPLEPADGRSFQPPAPSLEMLMQRRPQQRYEILHDQFAVGALRRRGEAIPGEERHQFNSNYRALIDTIKQTGEPPVARAKLLRTDKLGPLLEAAAQEDALNRTTRGSGLLRRRSTVSDAMKLARRMSSMTPATSASSPSAAGGKKSVAGFSAPGSPSAGGGDATAMPASAVAAAAAVAANLNGPAKVSATNAKSAVSTAKAQQKIDDAEARRLVSTDFNATLREAVAMVRPALTRQRSWPSLPCNMGLLRDSFDEMRHQVSENEQLRRIIDNQAPRKAETALKDKVTSLEEQILNQVSLIKGLRERLKVLQADHTKLEKQHAGSLTSAWKNIPNTEATTIVFCDVQSGAYLAETMPHIMASQFAIYRAVMRELLATHRGYEVSHVDQRFAFAFHTPVDACRWCIDVQLRLCAADWHSEVCENPETPSELLQSASEAPPQQMGTGGGNRHGLLGNVGSGILGNGHLRAGSAAASRAGAAATTSVGGASGGGAGSSSSAGGEYLWRGLRVKMGVQMGAVAFMDPVTNTVQYEGPAVDFASFLEQLAVGGEILIGVEANNAACGHVANLGIGLIQPWDSLSLHPSRASVFRVVALKQKARLRHFQRKLLSAEQVVIETPDPSVSAPPSGCVTTVTIAPVDLADLKENVPEAVYRDTVETYKSCVLTAAHDIRGCISRTWNNQFVVAFSEVTDAVRFALRVQEDLLSREYAAETLNQVQFATVRVKGILIFHGVRVRIGVHAMKRAVRQPDPMTRNARYQAYDSRYSSLLANAAVPGEILVSPGVVDAATKAAEALRLPVCQWAVDISVPGNDALMGAFQLFPLSLKARAAYVNRELRLKGEPENDQTDVVRVLERQIATLQGKLVDKDKWIGHLEEQVREKSSVIANLRREVLNMPFKTISVRQELLTLDRGPSGGRVSQGVIMALSFAHASQLFAEWGDEMTNAMNIYDAFVQSLCVAHHGHEMRRLQSGAVKLLSFIDTSMAAGFWLALLRGTMTLDWPVKLDDSEAGGVVLASEVIPGLHPSLDCLVWKGLRPIATMEVGCPLMNLNAVTSTYEPVGPEVNFVSSLLQQCSEGDCIVSRGFFKDFEPKVDKVQDCLAVEYGPFYRLMAGDMKMRNKVMRPVFSQINVETDSVVRKETALVVHLTMQTSPLLSESADFLADVRLFSSTVIRLTEEYQGHVIGATDTDFSLAFTDAQQGAEFSVYVHTALLSVPWSPALLRAHEFKEVVHERHVILRGIRAHVGAHFMEDIGCSVDLFNGLELWLHMEMPFSLLLARSAHCGETLCSEEAHKWILKAHGKRQRIYSDTVGSLIVDEGMLPSSFYECLPTLLKPRLTFFLEEDRILADPNATAKRRVQQHHEQKRREKFARSFGEEQTLLLALERNANPLDEPIHKKHRKLLASVKGNMQSDLSRFRTSLATMAVIETASMLSEDLFYLGEEKKNPPYHTHLILHQLERGRECSDPIFLKAYAGQLIGGNAPPAAAEQPSGDGGAGSGGGGGFAAFDESRGGGSDLSATLSGTNRRQGQKSDGVTGIAPEDVVQMHIDVERFSNLFLYHYGQAASDPLQSIEQAWVQGTYDAVVGPEEGVGESDGEKLKELTLRTMTIGMDVSRINPDRVRKSIVANLSLVLQQLLKGP